MSTAISRIPVHIPDLQTGMKTISRLPLGSPQEAYAYLHSFLDNLLKTPPAVDVYITLLEQLSHILCFVTEALARCFIDKPLPLVGIEEERFRQVILIWIRMARSYAHCGKFVIAENEPGNQNLIALILNRCIYYSGMALIEHHRARRELPPELWLDLHSYYASAEKRGVVSVPVRDILDYERNTHCQSTYIGLLLFELSSPYGLTADEQNLVRRWAKNYSPLVSLHPVQPDDPLPEFAVDLMQSSGARSTADNMHIARLRRLDTSHLAQRLKQIRQQLRQNIPPAEIGLGEGFTPRQCRRLLEKLRHPWSQAKAQREFPRRAALGEIQLGIGFAATYYTLSGQKITPAQDHRPAASRKAGTRGKKSGPQEPETAAEHPEYVPDQWSVLNQSANGFLLRRGLDGGKIAHGQLLALCPQDGKHVLLAQAKWLIQERKSGLIAGISTLPGIPQAITVRLLRHEVGLKDTSSPAFLLSAVPLIHKASAVVLPKGWYQADRLIEVHSDSVQRVRLKQLINEGPDFEQVSFEAESA